MGWLFLSLGSFLPEVRAIEEGSVEIRDEGSEFSRTDCLLEIDLLKVGLLLDSVVLLGCPYFLLKDIPGFPVIQGWISGLSELKRFEASEESREWQEWSSRSLLDSLRTLSESMELMVVQLMDSLSPPSTEENVSPLSSRFRVFELTESVLDAVLEDLVAPFFEDLFEDLFEDAESAPALDGLGDLAVFFTIDSAIRAKARLVIDKI